MNNNENTGIQEFVLTAQKQISWFYILWLAIGMLVSYGLYVLNAGKGVAGITALIIPYYFYLIVHICWRIKTIGKSSLLGPDILFLLMYTMFHLGYITLYWIGLTPFDEEIIIYSHVVPKTMFIINLGLLSFIFGYEMMAPKVIYNDSRQPIIPSEMWCLFGIAIMIVALLLNLGLIAFIGVDFFKGTGRRGIIYISEFMPKFIAIFFTRSTYIFTFGLTVYLIASALKYGKLFKSRLALVLTCIFLGILFLQVARGTIFRTLILIILVRHYLVKPFKIRTLVMMFVAVVMAFGLMRLTKGVVFDVEKMAEEIKYKQQAGYFTVFDPFIEAGASYNTLNVTVSEVPSSQGYWKGASWRDSIIHLVPFLQGYTLKTGISTWAPSQWVTTTFWGSDRAGRGFTVAAEGYLNFGFFGVFIEMGFFGLLIRWLMVRFTKYPSATWAFVMLGCIASSVAVIRNHLNIATGIWSQIVIIAIVLKFMLGNEKSSEVDLYQ